MDSQNIRSLPEVIRSYGEVAEDVNRREMCRFTAEIRSRWRPPSHEEEYRFEGWTSEVALTRCVYEQAFYSHDRPQSQQSQNASDAEINEQVQIAPSLDEIMNYVAKPLILPPLSQSGRQKLLERIESGMKQQVVACGVDATGLELPKDIELLFSTVRGIRAAGVPSEIAYTELIYPSEGQIPPDQMPYDVVLRRQRPSWPVRSGEVPIAALHLGGCEQHRSIYYVLSQSRTSVKIAPEATWQIWDRLFIEIECYDDVSEWLERETMATEAEGPPMKEMIVMYDRYPV